MNRRFFLRGLLSAPAVGAAIAIGVEPKASEQVPKRPIEDFYAFWSSAKTETVALSPKAPWHALFEDVQMSGYQITTR